VSYAFNPGDVVQYGRAKIIGLVISREGSKCFVELMFGPGKWIAHTIENCHLTKVDEDHIPDEALARRTARTLLGLDKLVKL